MSNMEWCSDLYTNKELSVLEGYYSRCSDDLYFFGKNYHAKYDWYDKAFNYWETSESCRAPLIIVIPAHAGIHKFLISLDTDLRWCDGNRIIRGAL